MPDLPKHIAIVMDGNGRWAKSRVLPRLYGHKRGVDALRDTVQACAERGISVLTVFAFSSENWARPKEEVSGLMDLLVSALQSELLSLTQNGIKLQLLGDRGGLSESIQSAIQSVEMATETNTKMCLNVCFNYGGRWDIAAAAARLAQQGLTVTEESLGKALLIGGCEDPDLIIRTGGEFRMSNFLLWQAAYSELFFSPVLWPDFKAQHLDEAINAYTLRDRRFGKVLANPAALVKS